MRRLRNVLAVEQEVKGRPAGRRMNIVCPRQRELEGVLARTNRSLIDACEGTYGKPCPYRGLCGEYQNGAARIRAHTERVAVDCGAPAGLERAMSLRASQRELLSLLPIGPPGAGLVDLTMDTYGRNISDTRKRLTRTLAALAWRVGCVEQYRQRYWIRPDSAELVRLLCDGAA